MVIFVLRLDLSADDSVCHPAAVSGQCQSPHSHRVAGGRPRLALPVGQPPVQPEEGDQQGRCQCSPCHRQSTSTSQPYTKVRGEAGNLFDYFLAFFLRSTSSNDQPLYKSYFFGLDQVGLDSSEDLSDDSGSVESDIYQIPDRTRSAPTTRSFDKKLFRQCRPKSCFPRTIYEIPNE